MTFIAAVRSGFVNYFNFSGRARPSEFWYWMLFATVIVGSFGIVDQIIYPGREMGPFSYVDMTVFFAALPPTLAVIIRRMRDFEASRPGPGALWPTN